MRCTTQTFLEEITSYQQGMEEGKNRTLFVSASVSGNGNKVTTAIGQIVQAGEKVFRTTLMGVDKMLTKTQANFAPAESNGFLVVHRVRSCI
jgi:hypothetical protein